ncbi:MAG TPA: hypothetical protein VFD32_13980 [Dehalococcoidia bacterium]|nr:hypothetical protein [Dehalococcoidia bacterium]
MTAAVTVHDETPAGRRLRTFNLDLGLDLPTARITVEALIRKRVQEEVAQHNRAPVELFQGLVQPPGAERTTHGYRLPDRRSIDSEAQVLRALDAFCRNGFIVIVNDRQMERLDEAFELRAGTEISFVKLVPLVGG